MSAVDDLQDAEDHLGTVAGMLAAYATTETYDQLHTVGVDLMNLAAALARPEDRRRVWDAAQALEAAITDLRQFAATAPTWCRPSCEDHDHDDPNDEEAEDCGCPAHGEPGESQCEPGESQ